jgi:putative transposase
MHLDIAIEVESQPSADRVSQQIALDLWLHEFNHVRPHEALAMKTPDDVYRHSKRKLTDARLAIYPSGWAVRRVSCGKISFNGIIHRVGEALDGYDVALDLLAPDRARLWFYAMDLGELSLLPRSAGYDTKLRLRSLRDAMNPTRNLYPGNSDTQPVINL